MYKEAMEAYKQAARLKPEDEGFYFALGTVCLRLGMLEETVIACTQAITIEPDYTKAHYLLGVAYSVNDTESALEQYKILKNLDPKLANELFDMIYK